MKSAIRGSAIWAARRPAYCSAKHHGSRFCGRRFLLVQRQSVQKALTKDTNGDVVTQDLLIGTGFGSAHVFLFGLPFKFDVVASVVYGQQLFHTEILFLA